MANWLFSHNVVAMETSAIGWSSLVITILIHLGLWTIVHAHTLCIDMIPPESPSLDVSTCNQSRWPSNGVHWFPLSSHCVMRNLSVWLSCYHPWLLLSKAPLLQAGVLSIFYMNDFFLFSWMFHLYLSGINTALTCTLLAASSLGGGGDGSWFSRSSSSCRAALASMVVDLT